MMESSVKTISRPVIDRLPVNQIDEFACRQLDRVSRVFSNVIYISNYHQIGRYGKPNGRDRSDSRNEGRKSQDQDQNAQSETEDGQSHSARVIEENDESAQGPDLH